MDGIWNDLRYAGRTLLKSSGFTGIAILTLALGVGANTAIFSVIHAILWRPLPYPGSDRLVRFLEHRPPDDTNGVGYPQQLASVWATDLPTVRLQATTLSHIGVYVGTPLMFTGLGEPIRVHATQLSPAVLGMLGVHAQIGRTFDSQEETPGKDGVVVLSHLAWQRYFGGTREILGRSLTLNGRRYSVIGVMPERFEFPDSQTQLWIPYALGAVRANVPPVARLADGVSLDAASTQVSGILTRLRATAPSRNGTRSTFEVQRVQYQMVAPVRPALIALTVAVGVVLLIACLNVANLLLARSPTRRREIAVRLALGASRGRLVRQLLTENLVLAVAGGVVGVVFAFGGLQLLQALGRSLPRTDLTPGVSIPRLDEIAIDLPVLVFAMSVTAMSALLFGLAPAVRQSMCEHSDVLRDSASSAPAGFNLLRHHRVQGVLVIIEIGLAMLLLVCGGLVIHSFINMTIVSPGYNPTNLLTFTVPTTAKVAPSFNEDLVARLQLLPGVRSVGYAETMPMVRFRTGIPITPAPPLSPANRPPGPIDARTVSRDFLRTLGVMILEGRNFTEHDGANQPKVMLINRALARSGFLGPSAVGARVFAGPFQWEVVGIVDDVHQYGLDQEPDPQVFFDIRQLPAGNPTPYFAVRTDRDPINLVSSIRGVVRQLDPSAIVDSLETMDEVVSNSLSRPRLYAVLFGIFAALAGALAAIGIYGVIAYGVAQRTREIGIRMALGATRTDVMRLVITQSTVLIGVGLALGLVVAVATTRYVQSLLFGLTPLDPKTFITVSLLFAFVAMVAAYVPGRHATRVDPMVALRTE